MPSTDWHYELIGLLLAWADVFWRLFSVPLYAIYEFTGRDPNALEHGFEHLYQSVGLVSLPETILVFRAAALAFIYGG